MSLLTAIDAFRHFLLTNSISPGCCSITIEFNDFMDATRAHDAMKRALSPHLYVSSLVDQPSVGPVRIMEIPVKLVAKI